MAGKVRLRDVEAKLDAIMEHLGIDYRHRKPPNVNPPPQQPVETEVPERQ